MHTHTHTHTHAHLNAIQIPNYILEILTTHICSIYGNSMISTCYMYVVTTQKQTSLFY